MNKYICGLFGAINKSSLELVSSKKIVRSCCSRGTCTATNICIYSHKSPYSTKPEVEKKRSEEYSCLIEVLNKH